MSENKKDVAPSMNPEEIPTLQDYMSKDRESTKTNACKYCDRVFPSTEELTAHNKKGHPESL